jgi:hypothetical protein
MSGASARLKILVLPLASECAHRAGYLSIIWITREPMPLIPHFPNKTRKTRTTKQRKTPQTKRKKTKNTMKKISLSYQSVMSLYSKLKIKIT